MQRLRASEMVSADGTLKGQGEGVRADGLDGKATQIDSGGVSTVNVSHEVTVESRPMENQETGHRQAVLPTESKSNSSLKQREVQNKKEIQEGAQENKLVAGQKKPSAEVSQKRAPTESIKTPESKENTVPTEPKPVEKKSSSFPDTPNRRKMAANLSLDRGLCSDAKTGTVSIGKEQPVKNVMQDVTTSSWCQTQLPEAVAERPVEVGATGEVNLKSKELKKGKTDKSSQSVKSQCTYGGFGSSSLGRDKTVFMQDHKETVRGASGYGKPYCPTYSVSGGAAYEAGGGASSDWQMDSVIEQIEKQMAAVLEKIEGDMPSLLEQISDHPETLPKAKSASSSPSPRPRSHHHSTPPPLPTTPRPAMPSLPHLTIPPPSYPPPSPPSHIQGHSHPTPDEGNSDDQRDTMRSGQSPRGSVSGKGL